MLSTYVNDGRPRLDDIVPEAVGGEAGWDHERRTGIRRRAHTQHSCVWSNGMLGTHNWFKVNLAGSTVRQHRRTEEGAKAHGRVYNVGFTEPKMNRQHHRDHWTGIRILNRQGTLLIQSFASAFSGRTNIILNSCAWLTRNIYQISKPIPPHRGV